LIEDQYDNLTQYDMLLTLYNICFSYMFDRYVSCTVQYFSYMIIMIHFSYNTRLFVLDIICFLPYVIQYDTLCIQCKNHILLKLFMVWVVWWILSLQTPPVSHIVQLAAAHLLYQCCMVHSFLKKKNEESIKCFECIYFSISTIHIATISCMQT
jgi:hypothetical protein